MENWNIQSIILVGNKMVLELETVKKVAHIEVGSWLHSVGSRVGLGFLACFFRPFWKTPPQSSQIQMAGAGKDRKYGPRTKKSSWRGAQRVFSLRAAETEGHQLWGGDGRKMERQGPGSARSVIIVSG